MSRKKSFLLYYDMHSTFEQLEDEEAGRLIKHIFSFVNGDESEPKDRLTKIAFEPIKQTLKRDEEAYQRIVNRNRENGNKGGRRPKDNQNPLGFLGTQANPSEPKKPDSGSNSDRQSEIDSSTKKKKTYVKKEIPSLLEFMTYAKTIEMPHSFESMRFSFETKYEAWVENKWHDLNGNPIKNWKTKLKSTLPYLKPMSNGTEARQTADERREAVKRRILTSSPEPDDFQRNDGYDEGGYANVITFPEDA